MVEALVNVPVDYVKVVTSGARGDVQMPRPVLRTAIRAARECGLPVAVHAHLQEDQLTAAVAARPTSIEHGFVLRRLPAVLERMAEDGVFLCPTLRVIQSIRAESGWYGQRLIPTAWEDAVATVVAAHAAGVCLIAGTDSGVYGVSPIDVWREVGHIADITRSAWAALCGATSAAAEALGRSDLGHLGAGPSPTWSCCGAIRCVRPGAELRTSSRSSRPADWSRAPSDTTTTRRPRLRVPCWA